MVKVKRRRYGINDDFTSNLFLKKCQSINLVIKNTNILQPKINKNVKKMALL